MIFCETLRNMEKITFMADVLLTVKEVMATLKISRATIYRHIDAGILTPVKIGGATRFRQSDITALINKRA